MTDAPDRIWAWEGDGQDGWENAYASTEAVGQRGEAEYIRLDLHEAAVAAARAEAWNAAIMAAAEEADKHRHYAKGIICCGDCIRKMVRASK